MKEPKRSSALVRRETFASYCFLLPSLIFFLGFVIYPMILCVVTSFFDSTMNRADIFVGMANYKTLFADPIFLGALKNTFVIVIVSVPITCIFSLWVSSAIVDLPEWATSLFRCVFYLPVVTGSVAVTVVWKWMYNNYYGIFNYLGKTLGIIGYGNIGSQLSVVAEALGMRVLFYDIEEKLAMGNAHRCDTLNELLEQSDVVTLHVDGRKSNTGFFGEDQFEHMKQDAIFINLSRGFVADLDALKKHLDSGHLSGAAVDVFPIEPKKTGDEFLTDLADEDNMILTPHIGGSTLEAQKSIGQFVSQRLEDYWFKGSTMLSVNLPQITLSDIKSNFRIAHLHANLPGVLARVNRVLGEDGINIAAQALGTEGEIGYVVTDVAQRPDQRALDQLASIEGTIRMRVIS